MVSMRAIRGCADFIVESPQGRIGTVVQIRYEPGDGRTPAALVVRAGRNGARLLVIPVSELNAIRARRRRVVTRSSPLIIATEVATAAAAPTTNRGTT
jgi:hypothetical protein